MTTKSFLLISLLSLAVACSNAKTPANSPAPQKPDASATGTEGAPLAVDTPNIYEFTAGPQGNVSIHIYSEDGIWVIEKNIIDVDGLPTPEGRWTFTTKDKAYAFAKANLGVDETQRNDTALDQEGSDNPLLSENLNSGDGLWKVTNVWNWDWEIAFAKWTRNNLHPDFFQKLGIENDCADAYYQARMIFAFENALPVTFRLAGGGAYFTQKTVRPEWKKLKTNADWRKNQQFLKALDYIANTTYTHTLGRDTYPVEMSVDGLIEGTAYLSLGDTSGHTLIVNEINVNDATTSRLPMYTLNSTVPKTVRPLYESMFYSSGQPQKSKYGTVGFVRFRWPKSSGATALVDMKDMPYYSEEQYDPNFLEAVSEENPDYKDFSITVFKKLNPNFDPTLRITEGLKEVAQMVDARKDVVVEGYAACKKGCADGSADYENWSTPSRDKRIKELITDLETYQSALYGVPSVAKEWENAQDKNIVELDGVNYLFSHLKWTFQNSFFDSNPNATPAVRWGMAPEAFAIGAFNQIAPLLEARKTKVSEKSGCLTSPDCAIFSMNYIANSTFIEDQDIQNQISLRNQYCSIVGEEKCALYMAALGTFQSPYSAHSNFAVTWNNIYVLNSDPRVPLEQRWGGMPTYLDTMVVDGALGPIGRFENSMAFTEYTYSEKASGYTFYALDTQTKSLVKLANTSTNAGSELNTQNGLFAYADVERGDIKVVDIVTLKTTSVDASALPKKPVSEYGIYTNVAWINANRFTVNYQTYLVIFEGDVDTGYTLVKILEDFTYRSKDKFAHQYLNLMADQEKPSQYQVTLANVTDDLAPIVQFKVNDILGKLHPSYLNYDALSNENVVVISWSNYSNPNGQQEGKIRVDMQSGIATKSLNIPSYSTKLGENVAISSIYNEATGKSQSEIIFYSDDLLTQKTVKLDGSCGNCYDLRGDLITVGPSIYKIDSAAGELKEVARLTGAQPGEELSFGALYGNYATGSSAMGDSYYSFVVDLSTGKALMVAQSVSLYVQPGVYPTVTASSYETVNSPQGELYYSMNLVLDLEHLDQGPIVTPAFSEGEGEGDGEHGGFEAGSDGAFFRTQESALKLPSLQSIKWSVKVLDPGMLQTPQDPLSVIPVNGQKTVFVFK